MQRQICIHVGIPRWLVCTFGTRSGLLHGSEGITNTQGRIEKTAGGPNSTATLTSLSNTLITRIDNGTYASQASSWTSCSDISRASACALAWAQDANALNCAYVLKVDETNKELDGTYYTGAQPYIELQIAKGGYRLGAWLNALAAAA